MTFPVLRRHGRVVLEPLRILRNDLRAAACFTVHEVHVGLPRRFAAQRIAVVFDEAVDEIDVRKRILHPMDVVAVELAQIARFIIGNEMRDSRFLRLFRHFRSLFEPVDDAFDGRRVHPAYAPDALGDRPVGLFHQLRVEPVGDRLGIAGIGHVGIELLGFGLRNPLVVVAARCGDHIHAGGLIEPLGADLRIEDGRADFAAQRIQLAEPLLGNGLDDVEQIALGEFGHELVVRIVMMDAVGEPDLFQVLFERFPLGAFAVARIVLVDRFERAAHGQIVLAILVVEDVAAALRGLGQIVDELLLVERKLGEARDLVTDHLDVVEAVDDPRSRLRLVGAGARSSGKKCHRCDCNDFFHIVRVHFGVQGQCSPVSGANRTGSCRDGLCPSARLSGNKYNEKNVRRKDADVSAHPSCRRPSSGLRTVAERIRGTDAGRPARDSSPACSTGRRGTARGTTRNGRRRKFAA